jgi:tetratricopeptide (TPR) repeat protein
MINHVQVYADRIALPHHALQFPLTPPLAKLQEALAAYQALRLDLALQSQPLVRRQEVTRFLRQFGRLLYHTISPAGRNLPLDPRSPVLLELAPEWVAYPWELLTADDEWIALRQGIVRYLAPPPEGEPAPPLNEPLRIAALSAQPLPVAQEAVLTRHEQELGSRFLTVAPGLLDPFVSPDPPYAYRAIEHALREDMEALLKSHPRVLLYSGYSSADGWYFETPRGTPQSAGLEWIGQRMRQAAQNGLQLLLLNDSIGLLEPAAAARHTRAFLVAGVPAVIRIEGKLARLREQDYVRALLHSVAEGYPPLAAHVAAVRRLNRRFQEGWDWSFLRLYLRALPFAGDFYLPTPEERQSRTRSANHPGALPGAAPAPEERADEFASTPVPPLFSGKRRLFNRHAETSRLVDALHPQHRAPSPLVFVTGPAGCGKTLLAQHLARRLRRHFVQIAFVQPQDVLPESFDLMPVQSLNRSAGGALQRLFGAIALHLGAQSRPALAAGDPAAAAPERWDRVVEAHLADGQPRLIVLDRLETNPGYDALCGALQRMTGPSRFLLLGRRKPPMVSGRQFDIAPLDAAGQMRVLEGEFLERLAAAPLGARLKALCAADLLAARLIRRLPRLPDSEALLHAAQDGPALLGFLADEMLPLLNPDARRALGAMLLFTHLVHRDLLERLTGFDAKRLQRAVTELQWLGLVDASDGDRYLAVPLRIQRVLAERLLDTEAFHTLAQRMVQAYQGYLLETQRRLPTDPKALSRMRARLALERPGAEIAAEPAVRTAHRLGVERINLADLSALLAEEHRWEELARLSDAAAPLLALPVWRDVQALLNHCLLGAGEASGDGTMQARALVRLASPALHAGAFAQAEPLLDKALRLLTDGAPAARDPSAETWELLSETYHGLSRCQAALGRPEAAVNLLLAAAELAQQLERPQELLRALRALLALWEGMPEAYEEALRVLPPRIQALGTQGHPREALLARRLLAEAALRSGHLGEARSQLHELLQRFRDMNNAEEIYRTRIRLAECQAVADQPEPALMSLHSARTEWGGTPDRPAEARALLAAAGKLETGGRATQALQAYLDARELLEAEGESEAVLKLLDAIGPLYYRLGEPAHSTRIYQERLQLQASLIPG